jgi:hypothetical protein
LAGNIFREDVDVCGPRCTEFAVVDMQASIGMADAPFADRRSPIDVYVVADDSASGIPAQQPQPISGNVKVVTFASLGKSILSATVA